MKKVTPGMQWVVSMLATGATLYGSGIGKGRLIDGRLIRTAELSWTMWGLTEKGRAIADELKEATPWNA